MSLALYILVALIMLVIVVSSGIFWWDNRWHKRHPDDNERYSRIDDELTAAERKQALDSSR